MTAVTQCDECEKTSRSNGQWIGVKLGMFAQPGDRGGQRLGDWARSFDFCSYRCLHAWSGRRRHISELEPQQQPTEEAT